MKRYFEVWVADGRYAKNEPLTYSFDSALPPNTLVTIPLQGRFVNGIIRSQVPKPKFVTKPIKAAQPAIIPQPLIELARWLSQYYAASLGDCLRLLTPSGNVAKRQVKSEAAADGVAILPLEHRLTPAQRQAISDLRKIKTSSALLFGDTGSGKTRIYLELAAKTLKGGRSVIILTPEIALTSQLAAAARAFLGNFPIRIMHSHLSPAKRKQIWFEIAKSNQPQVVIGPRSALFSPLSQLGLIVLDEAHEPAYKQDQSPKYQTSRAASKLASLTGAKAILGTATPLVSDYLLAKDRGALIRLDKPAIASSHQLEIELVDMSDHNNLSSDPYFSKVLLGRVRATLAKNRQVLIYLNRRGSARIILCSACGWRMACPNCDISLVYHADKHRSVCHSCGFQAAPPFKCPDCGNADIIYKSAGTKGIAEKLQKLFPNHKLARFDSDNDQNESLHELYQQLKTGEIEILVGTQLVAKGLDLPKLGMVGVISADTSLSIPDFTAGERAYQLISQVIGRVGRGHGEGSVVVQTHAALDPIITGAIKRDYDSFYKTTAEERLKFNYPPFAYLLKLECRRKTSAGAKLAASNLSAKLRGQKLPIQVVGPAPSFASKRGQNYYWQIIVKSKKREILLKTLELVGAGWSADLDPTTLL